MRKIIAMVIMFSLWSCLMYGLNIKKSASDFENNIFKDDDTIIEEKSEKILKCLRNKDIGKFISLYCPSIKKSNLNLENDIKKLYERINVDSYEILEITSYETGHFGGGQGIVQKNVYCELKINDIEYQLSFIYIKKNYADKTDVGLYSLELIESEKFVPNGNYYEKMTPGIYDSLKKE